MATCGFGCGGENNGIEITMDKLCPRALVTNKEEKIWRCGLKDVFLQQNYEKDETEQGF